MSWQDDLQPASWRGKPFWVDLAEARVGRNTAVHIYPMRQTDQVWVEDLGKAPSIFAIIGFLLGEDVVDQQDAFIQTMLSPGTGELVHPSLGSLTGSVVGGCRFVQRKDRGRYVEFSFDFVVNGKPAAPFVQPTTLLGTVLAAIKAIKQIANRFVTLIRSGLQFIQSIQDGITGFISFGLGFIAEVQGVALGVVGTFGNFGRYALAFGRDDVETEEDAQIAVVAAREAAMIAAADLIKAAGPAADPVALPAGVKLFVDAIVAALPSAREQIRVCIALTTFAAPGPTGELCRLTAAVTLATVASAYQPDSYGDAVELLGQVMDVFDALIVVAGDEGGDDAYFALRDLRQTVVTAMQAQGASLAPLVTRTLGESLPALVVAAQLYDDATRADEIVRRVDPLHPLFMPLEMQVLAS